MMVENLIAIAILIVFAIYFNYSISLIRFISDAMLFDQFTLCRVISELSLFRKVMLVLGAPIVLPIGLGVLIVNLLFRLRIQK